MAESDPQVDSQVSLDFESSQHVSPTYTPSHGGGGGGAAGGGDQGDGSMGGVGGGGRGCGGGGGCSAVSSSQLSTVMFDEEALNSAGAVRGAGSVCPNRGAGCATASTTKIVAAPAITGDRPLAAALALLASLTRSSVTKLRAL